MRLWRHPLVDIPSTVLVGCGTSSIITLWTDSFRPSVVFPLAAILTVLALWLSADPIELSSQEQRTRQGLLSWFFVVSATIFAGILRWGPYTLVQGGQDQGLYVNMAATLRRYGRLEFVDSFRAGLSPLLQDWYDRTYLFSFTLLDKTTSLTNIEFYPMHPALMAIHSWTFGGLGHGYMFIIGMIGVLAAWHLGRELDPHGHTAGIFALVLATNPAMVFFAKFPVSESTAFTFVVLGSLYLLRMIRAVTTRERVYTAFMCLLSFNCLFYVRWQFLLYVPFFLVIAVSSWFLTTPMRTRRIITGMTFALFALFGSSMMFYRTKQRAMYQPIIDSLADTLPSRSVFVAVGAAATALLLISMLRPVRVAVAGQSAWNIVRRGVPLLLPLVLLLSIPSILDLYRGIPMKPWGYEPPGRADAFSVRLHALFRLLQFAGPMFVVAVGAAVSFRKWQPKAVAVFVFVATCWVGVLTRPYVPYLYYYGRYLVVDLLPGILLLGSMGIAAMMKSRLRIGAAVLLASAVLYGVIFSYPLLGKHEGENKDFFPGLASKVREEDIVIVSSASQQLMVPLRGVYGIDSLAIPELVEGGPSSADLFREFGKLAVARGGRVLYLVLLGSGPADLKPIWEGNFVDSYFTNTDHFRGGGLANYVSDRRLLLPTLWQNGTFTWQIYDMTATYVP